MLALYQLFVFPAHKDLPWSATGVRDDYRRWELFLPDFRYRLKARLSEADFTAWVGSPAS